MMGSHTAPSHVTNCWHVEIEDQTAKSTVRLQNKLMQRQDGFMETGRDIGVEYSRTRIQQVLWLF